MNRTKWFRTALLVKAMLFSQQIPSLSDDSSAQSCEPVHVSQFVRENLPTVIEGNGEMLVQFLARYGSCEVEFEFEMPIAITSSGEMTRTYQMVISTRTEETVSGCVSMRAPMTNDPGSTACIVDGKYLEKDK